MGAGVGRVSARRLLAAFGSASAAMNAPPSAWAAVLGKRAEPSTGWDEADAQAMVRRSSAWLAARRRDVRDLADPDYPAALLQTADHPLVLLPRRAGGRARTADAGHRGQPCHATPQGLETARVFARELAAAGWCVVSGLAAGIDGAAHAGAIETGSTMRWSAPGLDRVYPRRHRALARQVAAHGLVVSELPWHPAAGGSFPTAQSHHRRVGRAHAGGRGSAAIGSLITAPAWPPRPGAKCSRFRLDPFAACARLPCPAAAGREAGRIDRRCAEELRAMRRRRPPWGRALDLVGPEAEAIRPCRRSRDAGART